MHLFWVLEKIQKMYPLTKCEVATMYLQQDNVQSKQRIFLAPKKVATKKEKSVNILTTTEFCLLQQEKVEENFKKSIF